MLQALLSFQSITYLSIKSSGPQQSWVKCVWSVCGHDDLDLTKSVEAIHLIQQL